MDRRAAGALLALAACIASSAAAPTVSNQTSLDLYDAASEGCYYNFQHYGEGDRIMTNEPCLNCTCHNRMLMCYLRVCPFTKPIGQDCTVEKRADQCCPIVTCPDVPVDLLTSTSTSSPAEYGATGLGKLDKYGCSINGKYFPEGSKVPPTPNKPCEHCYCIRNMTTCVMQECTLHVDGCTPIYHKDVCCPVRYSCDHPEDEMPLLDDMSTTVRPTPGFLLTTTTLAPVTQMTQDCTHNDQIFPDGTSIKTEKACEHCYCMKGDIVCVVQECGTPMENEGKNCTSQLPREGQCCPDTYICEGDDVTTELLLDYTTKPSLEKLTTLLPSRRVTEEGSGYRKEEEPIATELPSIEPAIEGSGDEFATVQPSDDSEKQTPSIFDERFSSTEDVIGIDSTSQSAIEDDTATKEPDSELNTVPSGTIEPSETYVPKLTTVSEDTKRDEAIEETDADNKYTTASFEKKGEEVSVQTTESAFRKEDEYHEPTDITSEKAPEHYTTSKEETLDTSNEQEPFASTESEIKSTTPALLEHSQTETLTEIPTTMASAQYGKEPSISSDHIVDETSATILPDISETTTLNAQENEIEDVSTTQAPSRIPGEGDCLHNGITYRNESAVPSSNNCQTDCKCISSIIKCDPIICSPPPEYMNNCMPMYDSSESCCPTYVCDGSKETLPPQPHSQMSETTSSTPTAAVECQGDQCEVQKVDESPVPTDDCNSGDCLAKPSDIPDSNKCGPTGCSDIQTPVQIDIQPECESKDCSGGIQPVSHEILPVSPQDCTESECQQRPIEKDDSVRPCDGENCKSPPSQSCENEEECKTINIPKVELPCTGESCKITPTDCNEEGCKIPSESNAALPCEGEICGSKDKQEPECEEGQCENITPDTTGKSPTDCNGDDCLSQPEKTEISHTENPVSAHDKETNVPSGTTENVQQESTKMPEYEDKVQTSEAIGEATTETSTEVTKLEEQQTNIPQFSSEKPLRDSDVNKEKTDKPSTDSPIIETTEYAQSKETTRLPESQTESQPNIHTTLSLESLSVETEAPETTKVDDSVTKLPEMQETTEIFGQNEVVTDESKLPEEESLQESSSKPEPSTEKLMENEFVTRLPTLSTEFKLESEVTEPTFHETQSETESLPEFTKKPEISDITSPDEQYTKEPESGSGEETTESLIKHTEPSVSDNIITEAEITTKGSEETSQASVETSEEEKATVAPEIPAMTTENKILDTSATTPSNEADESIELQDKKTEMPTLQTQEPVMETTAIPKSPIDNEEQMKPDSDIREQDTEINTTQPSILLKPGTTDTEKSIVDKEKLPELPSEESFTEQAEINTEEPSLITQNEDKTPEEPIEPESPDFIPVHPTTDNKFDSDLIDKETTPGSVSDVTMPSEHNVQFTTTESITSVETQKPELAGYTETSPTIAEEYDQDRKTTEPSIEILPTDNRKFNQDSTEISEPVTKLDELTTKYPMEEKLTESPSYLEPSTTKPSAVEESYATIPSESFSTEKQELIPAEAPASHVKETDSDVKLPTTSEITTEKLKPVESIEPQATSSTELEAKPTESQLTTISSESEKEKLEQNVEADTIKTPEQTSEPKFEYSETTPDMIELVEHNEMLDVSTLPSSTGDQGATVSAPVSAETEKLDDNTTTEKLAVSEIEMESDKQSTPLPSTEVITDEIPLKQPDETKGHETIPELPEKHKVHTEKTPEESLTTLIPDMGQHEPEIIPVQESSTEIVQTDNEYSTTQSDTSYSEQQTISPEGTRTDETEIPESDVEQPTTKQPEEAVTELKIKPEVELATEEPERRVPEVKPDEYYTEKPEIEQEPGTGQESTANVSEPSIEQEYVTEKTTKTKEPDLPIFENEVIPEKENIKPTEIPEVEKKVTPEIEMATEEPEMAITEHEITPNQEFATEISMVYETIKEPEIESSTEHKILPEEDIVTGTPESEEVITKESELPELELTTKSSAFPIAYPTSIEPELSVTTIKESSTELPFILETEKETESPEIVDKIKPDEITPFTETELVTERSETDIDKNKEVSTKEPEPSDIENEITLETTTKLAEIEHKLTSEPSVTEQPMTSIGQEIVDASERITTPETDKVTEAQAFITKEPEQLTTLSDTSPKPTTDVPQSIEIEEKPEKAQTTVETTIPSELDSKTTKPDISEDHKVPEITTKEPEISESTVAEYGTEPYKQYTTDKSGISSIEYQIISTESIISEKETTEHGITELELTTEEPEFQVKDEQVTTSSEQPVYNIETTEKTTSVPSIEEYTIHDDKEKETSTVKSEQEAGRLTTIPEIFGIPVSTEKEQLPDKLTEATPEIPDKDVNKYTTPGYTTKVETTVVPTETEKPTVLEEEIPVESKPETEKPTDVDLTKDTTAPEEEFLTVTTKATPPKIETEPSTQLEDLDKIPTKPHETQEETSSVVTPEVPKPGFNDVQATDEVPVPEEESHFAPSATGGYGQEPDYEDESQPFGPGTCRYGGKVYVSAQQIPRDDPCDFCFCFRSDIICLQQSCPPPIHGCHEEPIQGFCCPRYECPVSMASTLNVTTTTTTTTTTLPPHFLPHAYQGAVQRRGCQIKGHTYKVGEVVRASSGPCLHCTCGGDGQMKCDPKACTPEPMLRQMIAAAVSAKRRR